MRHIEDDEWGGAAYARREQANMEAYERRRRGEMRAAAVRTEKYRPEQRTRVKYWPMKLSNGEPALRHAGVTLPYVASLKTIVE